MKRNIFTYNPAMMHGIFAVLLLLVSGFFACSSCKLLTSLQKYSVTYNGNGEDGGTVPLDTDEYASGKSVTVLDNTGRLFKTGYTFSGWNTASDGSGTTYAPGDSFSMGEEDIDLYSVWNNEAIAVFSVTYDGNGFTSGTSPIDSFQYESEDSVTVLANTGSLAKTGYTFSGWNTEADGSGITYTSGSTLTMGTSNVVLFAHWDAVNYSVIYNSNGASGGTVPATVSTYHLGSTVSVSANSGSLAKTGYTFSGWNTAADGTGTSYTSGATLTIATSNIVLYALWIDEKTVSSTFTEEGPDGTFKLETEDFTVNGTSFTHYYHFRIPTNYNADKTRSYPLVVYLHAWGGTSTTDYTTFKDGYPNAPSAIKALPTSSEYPAFVYVPICPGPYPIGVGVNYEWYSDNAKTAVIETIKDLMARYNIDASRVYLVGFSMGGAGCWYLGYEYHRVTGSRFAAVSRGAGWYLNEDEERDVIYGALSLSPAWIHIGEIEGEGFTVGLDSYNYAKDMYGKSETITTRTTSDYLSDSGDGLQAEYRRLTLTTGAELRLSIYKNQGHSDLMFRNTDLIAWLFAQHL